jgi:hypothetical protein
MASAVPPATFPYCKCVCDCASKHTGHCEWDKLRVHQRIDHYYRGVDKVIPWVELICERCNKTRAFIPEYMREGICTPGALP